MAIFSLGNYHNIPFFKAFLGFLVISRDMSLFSVSYILIGPGDLDSATVVVRQTQNFVSESIILVKWSKTEISGPKLKKLPYFGSEAKNEKNKGTLLSQTLKVEESKVASDY